MRSISNDSERTIAVVDWHVAGHHITWFVMVCKALVELNCTVIALHPDPDLVSRLINPNYRSRIHFLSFSCPSVSGIRPGFLRAWLRKKAFGRLLASKLKLADRLVGTRVDRVHLSALYRHDASLLHEFASVLAREWTGLLVHARTGPSHSEVVLKDFFVKHKPRKIALLDESFASRVATELNLHTVVLPDLSNNSDVEGHPLERRFKRFAQQSKLVLQIGHMRQDKGVGPLARIAIDSQGDSLAFAFVGELDHSMSTETRKLLRDAMGLAPNAIFHLDRVSSEEEYNAIIKSCDVIYAAYDNFPHSSNTIAKAAFFRKPIIVSEGTLMAERVREFRLGAVVPYGDTSAILDAIYILTQENPSWEAQAKPLWNEYCNIHSFASFKNRLAELFELGD